MVAKYERQDLLREEAEDRKNRNSNEHQQRARAAQEVASIYPFGGLTGSFGQQVKPQADRNPDDSFGRDSSLCVGARDRRIEEVANCDHVGVLQHSEEGQGSHRDRVA